MDPVGLVQGALAPLQKARDATHGVTDLKTNLRRRYGDYTSIIETLKSKPEVITANKIERELSRLTKLFTRVAGLIGEYTADPADGRLTKGNIKAKRVAYWEDVKKELDEIDIEVMRQLAIMNLKGVIRKSDDHIFWRSAVKPKSPDKPSKKKKIIIGLPVYEEFYDPKCGKKHWKHRETGKVKLEDPYK